MIMGAQCYICFLPALKACKKCGRMVCLTHYDDATSLCVKCKGAASGKGKS